MARIAVRLLRDEWAQGVSEYALLVAGIVVLVIVSMLLFEADMLALFVAIGNFLEAAI